MMDHAFTMLVLSGVCVLYLLSSGTVILHELVL